MTEIAAAAPLIDAVIVFTAIEMSALLSLYRLTGKGVAPRDFLANMVAGLCLMLALRGVVRDAGIEWLALFLLAAGVAHGIDILMRWRRSQLRPGAVDRRVSA